MNLHGPKGSASLKEVRISVTEAIAIDIALLREQAAVKIPQPVIPAFEWLTINSALVPFGDDLQEIFRGATPSYRELAQMIE